MPSQPTLEQVLEAVTREKGIRPAARALGVPESTLRGWLAKSSNTTVSMSKPIVSKPAMSAKPTPSGELPIEILLQRRASDFTRRNNAHESNRVKEINVRISGPFGILVYGDPHLDDDGCDIPLIMHQVDLVRNHPAIYAATVGDFQNNWVGRLGRLYGEQGTTTSESWRLTEWFIQNQDWLFIVRGNHDSAFVGAHDPLDWIIRNADVPADREADVKLRLCLPDDRGAVTIHARHDFPGRSSWNLTHGQGKAAKITSTDSDVLLSGHRHCWGYHSEERPDGSIWHAIQVGSYKRMDSYAVGLGVPETVHGHSCLLIIDPEKPRGSPGRVTVHWDVDEGASFLTYLRQRANFL